MMPHHPGHRPRAIPLEPNEDYDLNMRWLRMTSVGADSRNQRRSRVYIGANALAISWREIEPKRHMNPCEFNKNHPIWISNYIL